MFHLTRQERSVVLFLSFVFLVGTALQYLCKRYSFFSERVNLSRSDWIARKTDLNRAAPAELEGLPGIGPVLAQRIIAYREEHGVFHSLEELKSVPGMSPFLYQKITKFLKIADN